MEREGTFRRSVGSQEGLGRSAVPGDPSGRRSRREPAQGGDGVGHLPGAAGDFGAAGGSSPGAVLHCESSVPGRPGCRTSAPARARRLLLLRAKPRAVGEATGAGPATGARRRGRGHGGVFLLCPRLRSAPLPPPAAVVSSPHSAAGSGSRARKAPSEVRAEPPARMEIAPRPPGAPPPAWAPPRGGGGRGGGRVGRGSHLNRLFPPGSSRAPRPRALSDSRGPTGGEAGRETPLGAVRRPRGWGWGWGCPGRRRSPSLPLSRTLGGHLAPDRGRSAASASLGRTPARTREEDKASPERAVTAAGQEGAPRTRRCGGAGAAERRG
uniref:Uncharacterized protein n=1 Tax=Rangifer tarandus platyrhynchus TaxID=3082113 RepID=A0ACB0E9E9_RANTA|nr:unnamed protein product [Rangifer tarandus platyrhynchus]